MPLFEYQCRECDHTFEALVVGGRRPESCPTCGSASIEKQFSTFGLGGKASGTSAGSSWRSAPCGPSGGG